MTQNSTNTAKVVPLKPAQKKKAAASSKTKAKNKKSPAKKKAVKKAVKKVATAKKPVVKKANKAAPKKTPKKINAKTTAPKKKVSKPQPRVNAKKPTPQSTPKDMETLMAYSQNQFDQFTKDAMSTSKESVDAFVQSGTIFTKGMETIIRETMAFAQNAAEKQAQFAKEAMSVKTINEFSDVQNKIAQANFDDFMSGATKITELGTKVLTDAIEPLNNQMTKTVQKATDAVAAE